MRIAVLDDDVSLSEFVCQSLNEGGHNACGFQEGKRLIQELKRESYDLLLLDWEVPDLSGFEVLKWVRANMDTPVPIMFLTCRHEETDVVSGLNEGADDYMVKPVRKAELLARVAALLRRAYPNQRETESFEVAPFEFDLIARRLTRQGDPIELTQKEFDLALMLFRNLGRLLSRSHIQEVIWGHGQYLNSRSMDTHISRVRSKLQLRPENGFRLTPVYSFGYRLEQVTANE
ncbi:response regulator transcription factor [Leeia oryzae]|uniref:response regulator transcription factor n=1 Tax=Leeia oryzae TaxID=356662 RepID=UPI0003798AAE|nr:response regulator transcription factor [Leeia oryzae]